MQDTTQALLYYEIFCHAIDSTGYAANVINYFIAHWHETPNTIRTQIKKRIVERIVKNPRSASENGDPWRVFLNKIVEMEKEENNE